jgi:hypothetical protein
MDSGPLKLRFANFAQHWLNVSLNARRRQVWIAYFAEPPHDAFRKCYGKGKDFKE